MNRRQLLRLAGGAALTVWVAGCQSEQPPKIADRASRALAIPPLAESRMDAQGRRVFDLTARAGRREFLPGHTTGTWGLNGDYLGPTLRAARGEQVAVNVRNELDEMTTMHWHGMHLPAAADGGPHQPVEPGQTWSPSWRIDQSATTLWYHPHPHGATERHVYRGLAGMFIIDDDLEEAIDLPREYGVDDIPVIVQDKTFDENGQFHEGSNGPTGRLGDTILVNGTVAPFLPVTTKRLRLRLLNASTARIYSFGFADDRRFALIGTDGGLLAAPYQTSRIQLSPAERAELVVSVQPGERVVLRSFPPELGVIPIMARYAGGADSFDVLELRAAASLTGTRTMPDKLVDVLRTAEADATTTRSFRLSGRQINGRPMDMNRIDEVVTSDTTELWEVVNEHQQPHSFHVHGVRFQVTSIGGTTPPPQLAGWKDTVYLPPKVPIRLIMRFGDFTDPTRPYMYHCHLMLHEDHGMMGQFIVTTPGRADPGRQPGPSPLSDGQHSAHAR
ncbi:multicopper oxidase domain-containing protein [Acrocarpospora macrocephala]|uniref:Multicopper oxidase n=1 Tax=Acrocarpospora macrocephala TaxID=150177 RepID=A0A5M3WQU1_9ACTN|nr:multicopper oxidase domain-containing protein [Acrocarpospora macrocephala]GES10960.1 multicopper oxidase [Acrocarpospora macrocephala]